MKFKLLPLLAVALVLSACGGSAASSTGGAPMPASGGSTGAVSAPAAESSDKAAQPGAITSAGSSATSSQPYNASEAPKGQPDQQGFSRMVIKTADLSITVPDVRAAEAAIRTRVGTLGGYVIQSQSNGTENDLTLNISFRVPVARFDDALSDVQGLAKKVLSSTVRGDDVTEEFVDLDSHRKTLMATRDRLIDLLNRATTVEDTLRINQTLNEIQTQIDQIEGRIKYLSQSAAMSTVNVSIAPVPSAQSLVADEGWQPFAIAQEALRGLLGFGQGLATILIVLLVWSPVWGALLLGGLLVARKLRGAPRKTNATP